MSCGGGDQHSGLVQLRDLRPLRPWKSPPLPLNKNPDGRYVKVKGELYRNGKRVYWQPKTMEKDDDSEYDVPYGGLFEFADKYVIKTIKRWIDKLFGQIFSLPRHDYD